VLTRTPRRGSPTYLHSAALITTKILSERQAETDVWTASGVLMDEMRDKLHPGSEQPPEENQPPLVPEVDSTEETEEEGVEAEVPQIDEGELHKKSGHAHFPPFCPSAALEICTGWELKTESL
jgi:hypothetical protein